VRKVRGHKPASLFPNTVPTQKSDQTLWFDQQVQPHESMLRAWLRARFPALKDVDDLVQESYARLLRAREQGAAFEVKSYLFATARNAALDLVRRNKVVVIERVENMEHLSVLEESPGVGEALSRDEELVLLAEAIQSLPDACRHVLVLQKIHGLSYKGIAARLGISERTVNAQIAKGVLRIRDYVRTRQDKR
jgi:RNA polymerase sigma-70 factor (ECF subfamily)